MPSSNPLQDTGKQMMRSKSEQKDQGDKRVAGSSQLERRYPRAATVPSVPRVPCGGVGGARQGLAPAE